jgi:hypothetical protein
VLYLEGVETIPKTGETDQVVTVTAYLVDRGVGAENLR